MGTNLNINPLALGSDVARSRKQYWARRFASWFVASAGLNRSGLIATEIVQAINPVVTIATANGTLLCRTGHGRLVWRARTFHTEEPETIRWLDGIGERDVYWDVGANIGLYAIYAAKFRGCPVVALKMGDQGAYLADGEYRVRIPGHAVQAVRLPAWRDSTERVMAITSRV